MWSDGGRGPALGQAGVLGMARLSPAPWTCSFLEAWAISSKRIKQMKERQNIRRNKSWPVMRCSWTLPLIGDETKFRRAEYSSYAPNTQEQGVLTKYYGKYTTVMSTSRAQLCHRESGRVR